MCIQTDYLLESMAAAQGPQPRQGLRAASGAQTSTPAFRASPESRHPQDLQNCAHQIRSDQVTPAHPAPTAHAAPPRVFGVTFPLRLWHPRPLLWRPRRTRCSGRGNIEQCEHCREHGAVITATPSPRCCHHSHTDPPSTPSDVCGTLSE